MKAYEFERFVATVIQDEADREWDASLERFELALWADEWERMREID